MLRPLGWISAKAALSLRTTRPRLTQLGICRSLHSTPSPFAQGSLFGEVTEKETEEVTEAKEETQQTSDRPSPKDDKELQKYYLEEGQKEQLTSEKFISPLKRKLFALNVAKNGFFKNGELVKDQEAGKTYRFTLTNEEIDILEPTVYLKSYRIKSSMKKATVVNRFVRGWDVKSAINQLHFNPKKMSTELEKLLKRGLVQAKEAGINEDDAYIQALWVGSDGSWVKRPDIKGRGRTGIIHHPYVHLKAILKGKQTKERIAWEKAQKQLLAKPKSLLNNEPLNFKVHSFYRW